MVTKAATMAKSTARALAAPNSLLIGCLSPARLYYLYANNGGRLAPMASPVNGAWPQVYRAIFLWRAEPDGFARTDAWAESGSNPHIPEQDSASSRFAAQTIRL